MNGGDWKDVAKELTKTNAALRRDVGALIKKVSALEGQFRAEVSALEGELKDTKARLKRAQDGLSAAGVFGEMFGGKK